MCPLMLFHMKQSISVQGEEDPDHQKWDTNAK